MKYMMKRLSILCLLCLAAGWTQAQEILDLTQCRALALQYNKELAASLRQSEAAHHTMLSYRGNFFPNISLGGMALYSTADGNIGKGEIPISLQSGTVLAV